MAVLEFKDNIKNTYLMYHHLAILLGLFLPGCRMSV